MLNSSQDKRIEIVLSITAFCANSRRRDGVTTFFRGLPSVFQLLAALRHTEVGQKIRTKILKS